MSSNITRASQEWASRPDDQRYLSLEELHAAVKDRKNESWTARSQVKELRVVPADGGITTEVYDPTAGEVRQLYPTNWSFQQLAQYGKAPAAYLRTLPGELAAINLQWGLENNPLRPDALVLAQSNGDHYLRSMTSMSYGRIWDHQVVEAVQKANSDGRWRIPAASYAARNPRRATTLYASDRDVFVFLVDDQHPIDVPTGGGREKQMFRGFFTWNSEVGSATFGLCTFLYDFVCDNRIIWGATDVQEFTLRHTGGAPERFAYEGERFLRRYSEESTYKVVEGITLAQNKEIPTGKDQSVSEWLQKRGFTKSQATASVEAAKMEEGDARTVWDVVNGVTAYARTITQTDERVRLETQAGKLMQLAA
jgi:hypothetical protein